MCLKKIIIVMALCVIVFNPFVSAADEQYASKQEVTEMRKEIKELRNLVVGLKDIIEQQNKHIDILKNEKHLDEQPRVTADIGAEDKDPHPDTDTESNFTIQNILSKVKPDINISGDFVANLADDRHMRTEDRRFNLRGVDIMLSGEIDNIAKSYINLAYHDDNVSLEEGFLDVYKLLPFKSVLRLGRFRVNFGLLNTVHPHGLPQVDYPAVYRVYLGHEGYIDEGIGISGSFPSLWKTPFQYSLQIVNGNRHSHGHNDVYPHNNSEYRRMKDYDDIVYIGRLQNRINPWSRLDVQWGVSGLTGKFEDDRKSPRFYLEGADLSFIWNKKLTWQTEAFFSQVNDHSRWRHSMGLYSFVDYRFQPKWIAGFRYDYAELPLSSRGNLKEASGYLTYFYTPRNRLRLQIKRSNRNYSKDTNEIMLQWVFTLGRHEH